MSAAESYDATSDAEQPDGERGYNLSPARRAFVVEHAQQPGWTTGRMAAELRVPPYIVSGWLGRRDVAEAIQQHTFERVREGITHLAHTPRAKTPATASPTPTPTPTPTPPSHPPFTDGLTSQPAQPAPQAPSSRATTQLTAEPYVGVDVTESGAILTPELRAVIVGKVRALCADAAREMAEESVRRVLRAELRELTIVTVREALEEIIEALAPLPVTPERRGDGDER